MSDENEVDDGNLPTEEQVEKYEMLAPMLDSLMNEMREFAKKKQDGLVTQTKVRIINRLLKPLKEDILRDEKSIEYVDLVEEEGLLPQNSDVVVILSQYQAALKQFKAKYCYREGGYEAIWHTKERAERERAEEEGYEDQEDDES